MVPGPGLTRITVAHSRRGCPSVTSLFPALPSRLFMATVGSGQGRGEGGSQLDIRLQLNNLTTSCLCGPDGATVLELAPGRL